MKIKKKKAASPAPAAAPSAEAASSPSAPAPRRAPSQYKEYARLIRPDMIAFHYWREWGRAKDRNDWDFMYEMSAPGSALRAQLGDREAFPEACRRRHAQVPGLRDGELLRIRLEGPDEAHMMRVMGLDERGRRDVEVERWYMLRSTEGWRIHQVDLITLPKERLSELTIHLFPEVAAPEGFAWREPTLLKKAAEAPTEAPAEASAEAPRV